MYFYCHAASETDPKHLHYDLSRLVLTGKENITLKDLKEAAPNKDQLVGNPLIFINACESAELSPLFYEGFVPYFLDKGARGVIGTECKVPQYFALEWAEKFFDSFLMGEAVGDIFLKLRRYFFEKHNNILGLMYAVYINADTRLERCII